MKSGEIARLFSVDVEGDRDIEITGLADLRNATSADMAFTESLESSDSHAGLLVVPREFLSPTPRPLIRSDNPKLLFTRIAETLIKKVPFAPKVHPTAQIADSAEIGNALIGAHVAIDEQSRVGDNCRIHSGVSIGRNVQVGTNTTVHPNCTIYENSIIGSHCVINAGVVIGAPGFGYVRDDDGIYQQFPQVGRVRIGDYVELGSNTCIDRGALGDTVIGDGTKIDNQVQIAHNVLIGKNVVIAAQTGISGSTVIEDGCVIGGQVGVGDHAVLKSGAVIGSQAGILPGKIVRPGIWWGTPVQPLNEYKRQNARVKGLDRLSDTVKMLKRKLDQLVNDAGS